MCGTCSRSPCLMQANQVLRSDRIMIAMIEKQPRCAGSHRGAGGSANRGGHAFFPFLVNENLNCQIRYERRNATMVAAQNQSDRPDVRRDGGFALSTDQRLAFNFHQLL